MTRYEPLLSELPTSPKPWLVKGVVGCIGSNLLAATATDASARNQIYNVAESGRTTLNKLFDELESVLGTNVIVYERAPVYHEFRAGDVRNSQADISKAIALLAYALVFEIKDGLSKAMPWYLNSLKA